MKRLLFLCVAFILFASVSLRASWLFDSTDVVTVTDSAVLDYPQSTWSMAGWYKMTNDTGASFRIIYQHVDWADAGAHFVLRAYEEDEATYGDDIRPLLDDDDTSTAYTLQTNCNCLADTAWHHFVYLVSSDNHSMYVDGTVVSGPTGIPAIDTISPAGSAYWGQDQDTGNQFLGKLAEWAFWTRALTETEIDKLSGTNGQTATSPANLGGDAGLTWHWDMYDALDTTSQTGSLTATHSNTSADADDHPVDYGGATATKPTTIFRRRRM